MQSKPENCSPATSAEPRHLYEYSVVRFSPKVEREEFINVGLVMMCKRRKWVNARVELPEALVRAFAPDCDTDAVRRQLQSFELVAQGCPGPIGSLEAHERFRWLTAVRSACITTSRPHPGHCADLEETFARLYAETVER